MVEFCLGPLGMLLSSAAFKKLEGSPTCSFKTTITGR